MRVTRSNPSDTKAILSIQADAVYMVPVKEAVLQKMARQVKVSGFREGKAPLHMVEKHVDQQALQTEFMEQAIAQLYAKAATQEKLRPIDRPHITLKKFVPFTSLEFEAEVEILGTVKLPNYKKIKATKKSVLVSDKEINDVLANLRARTAETKEVSRAARSGDKVWIDFTGKDSVGAAIKGAEGQNYPLLLGTDTFVPWLEKNLVGQKAGSKKTFTVQFPKDYGVKTLAGQGVTFTATVRKVEEVTELPLNDTFAAKVGPFQSLQALKSDIKKQLEQEKKTKAQQDYEAEIVNKITERTKLNVPETLVDDQIKHLENDLRQNLAYRGQTFTEYLQQQGVNEDEHRKTVLRPEAERRVKTGLVLAEIASEEKLHVSDSELEMRMQMLRSQYAADKAMLAELAKPEAQRDIASRLLTEKTIKKLLEYTKE